MESPRVVVVNLAPSRALVRQSVRYAEAAGRPVAVVDVDDSYVPVGTEPVLPARELGVSPRTLHLWAAALGSEGLAEKVGPHALDAVRRQLAGDLQLMKPGVLPLRSGTPDHSVRLDASTLASARSVSASETGELAADGVPVSSVDLSGLDPDRPWLFDARESHPSALMSRHPAVAAFVAEVAARVRADERATASHERSWDMSTTSLGIPLDRPIRWLYENASASGHLDELPDPYEAADAESLRTWLTTPSLPGRPARYLEAIHGTRADLRDAFVQVPGGDTGAFLAWVGAHARLEGYAAEIVEAAQRVAPEPTRQNRGRPVPGVTVVGYLTGELGIGESARQLVNALSAAKVPHTTRPIDLHLTSRQRTTSATADGPPYDTTVICVNADLTPSVAAAVRDLLRRSYRIGMWYWEVEDFPPSQHGGFGAVDEVWVATDFIRRAIEPHSPVPVRTLTPSLPQRGADPTLSRAALGLPDAPVFLFSFDYLSTAERKNPVGLVEAFERAFRPGEGPVLVIKSINADKRVADAERLRIRAASRPDVLLLEDYLEPAARDALVAHCDCYVSLHRSEGLGLTMAEAMAWGKPVIATGYSGNLQFMTDENSFLVPWSAGTIPADAAPYPPGGVWADPDLDAAAKLMRLVVDSPDVAAARGAVAARDIAALHSAEVAGRAVAARLSELQGARKARARRSLTRAARRSVRAAVAAFRDELR
ncbi:hypothetical protein CELL_01194 [Cellulomonas sp. T2.31MG-18]